MSDRIAVMDHGVVKQVGLASEIYEEPNCRFVADFIGETNFIDGVVASVDGDGYGEFVAGELRFIARVPAGISPGRKATLTVRPERVQILRDRPDGRPNTFVGSLRESIYIGTDTRFIIDLSPTVQILARQQNALPIGMPVMEGPAGVKLWVTWAPNSARILVE